jgi:signal peptidase I
MSTYFRDSGKYIPDEIRHRSRRRILAVVKFVFITFFIVQFITVFLISHYEIRGNAMYRSLGPGVQVLASPLVYGPHVPFSRKLLPGLKAPERGDIVVYLPPEHRPSGLFFRIIDPVVRFFTLRSVHSVDPLLRHIESPYMIRRVIGIPGDTITYGNEHFLVMGTEEEHASSEFERTDTIYSVRSGTPPFFLDFEELTLGGNEYFLAGDNREITEDSRYWGPVNRRDLYGKVLIRFLPLKQFGSVYQQK